VAGHEFLLLHHPSVAPLVLVGVAILAVAVAEVVLEPSLPVLGDHPVAHLVDGLFLLPLAARDLQVVGPDEVVVREVDDRDLAAGDVPCKPSDGGHYFNVMDV